jgi:hypothetical protein
MFTFPAIILTIPFGLVLVYWLMVIIGALDLDLFDFGGGDNGLASSESGGLSGFLASTGLTGVPSTVALSLPILWGWLFTTLGSELLRQFVTEGVWYIVGGLVLILVSLFLAVLVSALLIRPLRRLFPSDEGMSRSELIGKLCEIRTMQVNEKYGQAEFDDGGAGLLIQVRAREGNGLKSGDKALIVEYDDQREAFMIRAYDALAAEFLSEKTL